MVKEDFHINQKEWQEIEEYENEYRKNVKKQIGRASCRERV